MSSPHRVRRLIGCRIPAPSYNRSATDSGRTVMKLRVKNKLTQGSTRLDTVVDVDFIEDKHDPDWDKQIPPVPMGSVFATDPAIQGLTHSTRLLEGTEFYQTAQGQAAIHVTEQQKLLREAHFLAQLAWHDLYQRHFPDIWADWYLWGPEMVLFGKKDLEEALGNYYCMKIAEALPSGVRSHTIEKALDGGTFLRNNICHARFYKSHQVDDMLEGAQRLVCVIGDEARALQIREIRDRFKVFVQYEYRKLANCKPLEEAPEPHQQATFLTVMFGAHEFEDEIQRAAAEWNQRYHSPGHERPNWNRVDSTMQTDGVNDGPDC